jgi:hypothetical protein
MKRTCVGLVTVAFALAGAGTGGATESPSCMGTLSSTDGPAGVRDDISHLVKSFGDAPGLHFREFAQAHEGFYGACAGEE